MTAEQHPILEEITRVRALLVECPSLEAENPALRERYNNLAVQAAAEDIPNSDILKAIHKAGDVANTHIKARARHLG